MDITAQRIAFRPGDAGYDEELAGFQTGFAARPAVVFGAETAADVVAAVSYATARALPVGVQATGHGLPGASELFWGLLGGGANLGVVTELEIGLVPVTRVYGGAVAFDGREVDPAALLRGYEEWTRTVPDELTSSLSALAYPDIPQLPPHLRGRYLVSVHVAFTGTPAEGERLVAPLRALGPAVSDTLREMPYTESRTIHSDPDFPHAYYGDSVVLDGLDVRGAAELLALTGPEAASMHVVKIHHLGGALARPARNAVSHRGAGWVAMILSPLDGTDVATVRELHAEAFGRVAPQAVGRFLNFAFGGGDRPEGIYEPETRKRLAELKATYDPANLFRRNYDVG